MYLKNTKTNFSSKERLFKDIYVNIYSLSTFKKQIKKTMEEIFSSHTGPSLNIIAQDKNISSD